MPLALSLAYATVGVAAAAEAVDAPLPPMTEMMGETALATEDGAAMAEETTEGVATLLETTEDTGVLAGAAEVKLDSNTAQITEVRKRLISSYLVSSLV